MKPLDSAPDYPECGTVRQWCKRAGYPERPVRAAIRRGEIPVIEVPGSWDRIRWADFEAWLRSHTAKRTTHAQKRVAELLEREGDGK